MVRLSGLIALAISIVSVRATPFNLGWTGEVSIDETRLDNAGDTLYADIPITLRRVLSTANILLLEVFATPYRVTNSSYADDGIPTTRVASETVQVQSGADEVLRVVSFDIGINWRDYYIYATVTPQGENQATQNQPAEVVLAADENGFWTAVDPGVYQHEINLEIIDDIENFPVVGEDDPEEEDPSVGRTDPEIMPLKPKENGSQGNVTTPGGGSTTPTGPIDGTPTGPGDNGTPTGTDGNGTPTGPGGYPDPTGPDGKPTYPGDDGGGGGDGKGGPRTLITITRTTTICPSPSPPPPPCPEKEHDLYERQISGPGTGTITPAYITGQFFYLDPSYSKVPIVAQRILLKAKLYKGDDLIGGWKSWSTTGAGGITSFKFSIREGQRIEVVQIRARMSSYSDYLIGTRTDSTQDFTVSWAETDLDGLDILKVNAGKTVSFLDNVFPKSPANDGLRLADTLHTVTEYAKNNVLVPGEQQRVHVWFPSINKDDKGNLKTASLNMNDGAIVYINMPQKYAEYPGTVAHEYGHFMHHLAINVKDLPGPGGPHGICNGKTYDEGLTFSEGYATAFAMQALDQTHLQTNYMEFEQPDFLQDFEIFNCPAAGLNQDEGRIAAAILEFVDRKLDKLPTMTGNIGNIDKPFDATLLNARFDQRLILWEIMKLKPNNMVEYWTKLKPKLTTSAAQKALAILKYNYAESTLFK
ncbi:Fc.00g003490.m01.CDS01 [Cosmosporella sp. VM-42]